MTPHDEATPLIRSSLGRFHRSHRIWFLEYDRAGRTKGGPITVITGHRRSARECSLEPLNQNDNATKEWNERKDPSKLTH